MRNNTLSQFGMITDDATIASVIGRMRAETKRYIQASGLKSLVVGISGGVDSAFAVALLHPVCQELGIPLYGRSITIETNKPDEIARSQAVGPTNTACTPGASASTSHRNKPPTTYGTGAANNNSTSTSWSTTPACSSSPNSPQRPTPKPSPC
ncbi:MAG: hypothetical protein IKN37_06240 [Bacteroidales bacterium]|nr:hypothetical protein [Bacteroidales bacterium]